jgi:hypothetical protein
MRVKKRRMLSGIGILTVNESEEEKDAEWYSHSYRESE